MWIIVPRRVLQHGRRDGMGPKRVSQYGEEIVAIVRQFSDRRPDENGEWEEQKVKRAAGSTFLTTKKMLNDGMSAEEIAKTINRSRSYVFKAMKEGFTETEWELLNARMGDS